MKIIKDFLDKTTTYWHRYVVNPVINAKQAVRFGFQRMFRGYDDSATWGLDYYVAKCLPGILRDLSRSSHGYPGVVVELLKDEIDKLNADSSLSDDYRFDATMKLWRKYLLDLADKVDEFNASKCSQTNPYRFKFNLEFKETDDGNYIAMDSPLTKEEEEENTRYLNREMEIENYRYACLHDALKVIAEHIEAFGN